MEWWALGVGVGPSFSGLAVGPSLLKFGLARPCWPFLLGAKEGLSFWGWRLALPSLSGSWPFLAGVGSALLSRGVGCSSFLTMWVGSSSVWELAVPSPSGRVVLPSRGWGLDFVVCFCCCFFCFYKEKQIFFTFENILNSLLLEEVR